MSDISTTDSITVDPGPAPLTRPEKKRRRPPLSCEECRRRKIKCDRTSPCIHCVKTRKMCFYAPTHTPVSARKRITPWTRPLLPVTATHTPESTETAEFINSNAGTMPVAIETPSTTATGDSAESLLARVHELEGKLKGFMHHQHGVQRGVEPDEPAPLKGTVAKTRYFGQSHWINGAELFSAEIDLINAAQGEQNALWTGFAKCKTLSRRIKKAREPILSSATLCQHLPSRPLSDALIEHYLRTFEGILRVVHIPTFRADYARYCTDPSAAPESFKILLQLCMAVGATFHDDLFTLRVQAIRWVYEANLWLMLPGEKSRMTLAGLQVFCLVVLAKNVCAIGQDLTWISAAALLRKAMYMGLHRDPGRLAKMSRYRAEMRRRLWATILELNLQASFDAGGSSLVSTDDYDTNPPADMDDEELTDEVDGVYETTERATQMTVALALARSYNLRNALLKQVNQVRSTGSYDTTLRFNADLTKACRALTSTLTSHAVSEFHHSVAQLYLYRCFHALHAPIMARAMHDPRFYFSRKVCIDSSMRVAQLCGLAAPHVPVSIPVPGHEAPQLSTTLPPGSDWKRLLVNGSGLFRNIPTQSIMTIAVSLLYPTDTLGAADNTTPEMRRCLEAARGFWTEKILSGETNVKGASLMLCIQTHIHAIDAGMEGDELQRRIMEGALASLDQSWAALGVLAEREGVAVDEGQESDVGEVFGTPGEDWMAGLAWGSELDLGWIGDEGMNWL